MSTLSISLKLPLLFIDELNVFLTHFLAFVPGKTGKLLRRLFLRARGVRMGKRLVLDVGVSVLGKGISLGDDVRVMRNSLLCAETGTLTLGNKVGINSNSSLDANDGGTILIGSNVMIGQNVVIRASNHNFSESEKPISEQGHIHGSIEIGDDVWIGSNTVITAGASVGSHCVISAGSLVTKKLPANTVCAGVPAKVIRYRSNELTS